MTGPSPYAAGGYQWLKFEPHLHTLHSDGHDSVHDMLAACKAAGYDAAALTDHNTQSGVPEAATAAAELGLILVPGVEVTTFRGHALALGVSNVPEWRDLETRGMNALASDVHAQGGVLSVAHPVALGSPICSGCAWDWPIEPAAVDMWEVFSAPRPMTEAPLVMWRQMLQRGGRSAPVAAGDVHSVAAASSKRAATYVAVQRATREGVLEALRERRVSAGAGRPLELWLEHRDGRVALVGDCVDGPDWIPCASVAAEFKTIQLSHAKRCVYAEMRDVHGGLEAVSAAIWMSTSQ